VFKKCVHSLLNLWESEGVVCYNYSLLFYVVNFNFLTVFIAVNMKHTRIVIVLTCQQVVIEFLCILMRKYPRKQLCLLILHCLSIMSRMTFPWVEDTRARETIWILLLAYSFSKAISNFYLRSHKSWSHVIQITINMNYLHSISEKNVFAHVFWVRYLSDIWFCFI